MSLLKTAKPEMAYLKMGIYGEPGTGKTFTASKIAIGLTKFIKSDKPVAFLDTETGSDFVIGLFEGEGVKLIRAKTRAFKDLLEIVDEAEKDCSVLIIDSITHIWNDVLKSYQEKVGISRMSLRHWIPVKQTWRDFTDRYINSSLHIIMAGRSAIVFDDVEDEDGIKEIRKVGTKMKTETDTGHEPSLLIEMESVRTSPKTGAKLIRRAWVIKDRFDLIDGKCFDNPDFESFLPHVQSLAIGGKHQGIDLTRDSKDLFEKGNAGYQRIKKHDILMDKINIILYDIYPGRSDDAKKGRLDLMEEAFGTRSWEELKDIDTFNNTKLDSGYTKLLKKKEAIKQEGLEEE